MVAGALFGAGWWFWLDACTLAIHRVPFDQYLPGIIATLALVMINLIRKDELAELDPFDDASYCRSGACVPMRSCAYWHLALRSGVGQRKTIIVGINVRHIVNVDFFNPFAL